MRDHRGSSALAVHTRNADALLRFAHEPAEKVGSVYTVFLTSRVTLERAGELWIVTRDRGRIHDDVVAVDMVGRQSVEDIDTE